MKKAGLSHPKTLDLAARLGITRRDAIGLLELFWAYTADYAPQGDVGRWNDGAIAGACEWTGTPSDLTDGLVGARFVDRCSTHRLVVHDWKEHAPRWVHLALGKRKIGFVVATIEPSIEATTEPSIEPTVDRSIEPSIEPRPSPSLTSPSLPSPSLPSVSESSTPLVAPKPATGAHYPPGFLRAWGIYPHYQSRRRKAEAFDRWRRLRLESKADAVCAWIEALAAMPEWTRDGGDRVPGMHVWLPKVDFDEPPPAPADAPYLSDKGQRNVATLKRWAERRKP